MPLTAKVSACSRCRSTVAWLIAIVLGSSLLVMVQRAFAFETEDGALDALRTAGLPGSALFWGKTAALAVQLFALVVVLICMVFVMFYVRLMRREGANA